MPTYESLFGFLRLSVVPFSFLSCTVSMKLCLVEYRLCLCPLYVLAPLRATATVYITKKVVSIYGAIYLHKIFINKISRCFIIKSL